MTARERGEYRLSALERTACFLVRWAFRLLGSTFRHRIEGEERLRALAASGRPVLIVGHHGRLLCGVLWLRRLRPTIMTSQSRDGARISAIVEGLGWRTVRGSSSRGGVRALIGMIRALAPGGFGVHLVDGPRGPAGVVKPGLIPLAQRSGAAVVPSYGCARPRLTNPSWDRTQLPLPFSRVWLRFDEPLEVSPDLDDAGAEAVRREIEKRLAEGQARLDRDAGLA